jgi:hypothetical protein
MGTRGGGGAAGGRGEDGDRGDRDVVCGDFCFVVVEEELKMQYQTNLQKKQS